MKPAHERNQECLPPKKRDLPVSSSIAGGGADGGGREEGGSAHSSDSACREPLAGGSAPGEWIRVQPGAHYSVENPDGLGADYRDSHLEREKEVNGGEEEERGGREPTQDPAYSSRGPRAPHSAPWRPSAPRTGRPAGHMSPVSLLTVNHLAGSSSI